MQTGPTTRMSPNALQVDGKAYVRLDARGVLEKVRCRDRSHIGLARGWGWGCTDHEETPGGSGGCRNCLYTTADVCKAQTATP